MTPATPSDGCKMTTCPSSPQPGKKCQWSRNWKQNDGLQSNQIRTPCRLDILFGMESAFGTLNYQYIILLEMHPNIPLFALLLTASLAQIAVDPISAKSVSPIEYIPDDRVDAESIDEPPTTSPDQPPPTTTVENTEGTSQPENTDTADEIQPIQQPSVISPAIVQTDTSESNTSDIVDTSNTSTDQFESQTPATTNDTEEAELTEQIEQVEPSNQNQTNQAENITDESQDAKNENNTIAVNTSSEEIVANQSQGQDGDQEANQTYINETAVQEQNQTEPAMANTQAEGQGEIVEAGVETPQVVILPTTFVEGPEPTKFLPNPTKDLTPEGQECLQKCRNLGGISCKKWEGKSITCCRFTGCQWPFYCNPASRIQVEGCTNLP